MYRCGMQATCVHARVKLLLWDMSTTGEWSLAAQEDAIKLGDCNVSALFNVGADILEGVPKSVQVPLSICMVSNTTVIQRAATCCC